MTPGEFACDDDQVVGNDAPPNPAFQTVFAPVGATIQVASALQSANASFDARSKTQRRSEPALPFLSFPPLAFRSGLGQSYLFHAQVTCELFVRFGEHAAIGRRQLGRMPKQFPMVFQARTPLRLVGRIAGENAILGDEAAIDFTVPELAAKFGFTRGRFAPLDNGRVRLKQTHDLFWRRHRLVLQDPPRGLLNHAAYQGHIVRQEIRECQGAFVPLLAQACFNPLDLRQNGFNDFDQLAIGFFAQFFEFF